eukprot:5260819-Amphidinium_carterae.2
MGEQCVSWSKSTPPDWETEQTEECKSPGLGWGSMVHSPGRLAVPRLKRKLRSWGRSGPTVARAV